VPAYIKAYRCDACGECIKICPSGILHMDDNNRKAFNIEPSMCWECFPCVKVCPQEAIEIRGYSDFVPLGAKVVPKRDTKTNTITWDVTFRSGRKLKFVFPIRTTPWGSIKPPQDLPPPSAEDAQSSLLAEEIRYLGVPALSKPSVGTRQDK